MQALRVALRPKQKVDGAHAIIVSDRNEGQRAALSTGLLRGQEKILGAPLQSNRSE